MIAFTVLISTIITFVGFVVYRYLKQHGRALRDRLISVSHSVLHQVSKRLTKRLLFRLTLIIGIVSVVVYSVPVFVSSFKSRPLYGNFDIGMKCMCGHETFLHLEEDEAFEHCPGHRDMSVLGRIERHKNSVTIHRKEDDAPWCRVESKDNNHSLVFLKDSSAQDLPQVNTPWRTWLPELLPE